MLSATRWSARRALVLLVRLVVRLVEATQRSAPPPFGKSVCIESGAVGFALIDVQEVEGSAIEHFGQGNVARSVVDDRSRYLRNARRALLENRPRFY